MSSGDGVAASASAASSSLAAAAASSHAGAAATSTTARGVPAKKREKLLIAQQQSLLAKQQDQPQQSATKAGAEHASSTPLGGVARTETTSQQQQVPTVEVVVPVPSFPALIAQQQSGGSNNVPSLFGANGQTAPSSSSASPSMLSPLSSVIGDSPSRLHSKHSLTPPSSGGEGGGKKRKRSPYRCQKCNKPKKGHICTVTDSVLKDRETVPTPTPMVLPKPSIGGVGQPYTLPPINSSLPSSPAPSSSSSVLKTGHLSSSSSSPTAPSSPAAHHHSPMMLASVSSTSSTASSSTAATSILDGSEAAELFEQGSATTSGSQDPYLLPSSLSGMGFSTNSLEELFAGVPGSSFPIRGFSSTDLLLASMEPQDLVSTAYPQGMPLSGVGIPLTETNATFFLSWFDMAISSMRLLEIFLKTQRPSWRPLQTVLSHLRDERKTLRKWKKEFGEAVIEPAEGGQSIYSAATYPQHHWQRSEKAAIEEEDDEEAEDEEEEEQQKRSKRLRSSRRPTRQHKAKTTSNNSEEEEELEQEQDVTKIRQQKQQQRSSTSTSSTTPNSQPQRGP
ncbi:CCHC-type domain-containing protein [Balamuthia mandrillaris]